MTYSENIATLQPSATIAVTTLARKLAEEGRDIIDLSAGEPDFDTPSWISDAGVAAIRAGQTRYTPAPGLPDLRQAVAEDLLRNAAPGWELAGENVVVSNGAKQALFNVCFSVFGPEDEVLVASPYWTTYPQTLGLSRAEARFVQGPEERGFRLTPEDLERARTPATRGLILCSPSNPTGTVYSAEELLAVVRWAREHDVFLVSDEIYRRICFSEGGGPAPGLTSLPREELGRFAIIDGVSKSFAMTGWRIGYSITDAGLARKVGAFQSQTTSNPATPSQLAALEALTDRDRADESIGGMLEAFRRRRDLVVSLIHEHLPHLGIIQPEGAFYIFVKVDAEYSGEIAGSQDWCSRALEEHGVALVPGIAFGDDRYVRLSYATSDELLEKAVRRLAGKVA